MDKKGQRKDDNFITIVKKIKSMLIYMLMYTNEGVLRFPKSKPISRDEPEGNRLGRIENPGNGIL